ncbi:hypothetical protein LCGC14_2363220 [marine sediment metagenome]|uniref:Uncharacterized protein n=1 Tax=marine sediment metagenome TaxID=412755 RepID=A0A0F9F0Q8_9ZZZZ
MNLKTHVTTLKTSKLLVKNGWDMRTLFYWYDTTSEGGDLMELKYEKDILGYHIAKVPQCYYPAPLASEIGEELAKDCKTYWTGLEFRCECDKKNGYAIQGDNETEIRAQMWIYLKKEGLI